MWRPISVLLAAILVSAGAARPAPDARVRLTIDARTGSLHSVLVPSAATLECDGGAHASGFLRRVAKPACKLARRGTLTKVAAAHRQSRVCTEIYGGPQRAHIKGTVGHRHVNVTIDRADGCGIADWDQLRALLGDPERSDDIPRPKRRKATTTTTTAPTTYRIQRGDTLTDVAKRFHTSVAAIVATNRLVDPDHLTEGQELVMPPPSAVRIEVALVDGSSAQSVVRLTLIGANPSELVTFVISLPGGSTFTGTPHLASGYGVVTATYTAALGTGTYVVRAVGSRGTEAQTAFHLDPPG